MEEKERLIQIKKHLMTTSRWAKHHPDYSWYDDNYNLLMVDREMMKRIDANRRGKRVEAAMKKLVSRASPKIN